MLTLVPTDAIAAARRLLRIATAARDAGVPVTGLQWAAGVLVVTVDDPADVDLLGDCLDLAQRVPVDGSRGPLRIGGQTVVKSARAVAWTVS